MEEDKDIDISIKKERRESCGKAAGKLNNKPACIALIVMP
jgi:hypothetical protein